MLSRRQLLSGAAGALLAGTAGRAPAAEPSPFYELRYLEVPGDRKLGQRLTLLVPKHLGPGVKVPLLVLLHGLGETGDQRLGAYAWVERYGLGSAYDRLCQPPIKPTDGWRYWQQPRLAEVNRQLAEQPFRGLVIACPFTPNVYKLARQAALDAYADWLVDTVIPRARREAPVQADAAHTSLNGCSLGGYVGLEIFLRKPEHFGAWGSVQGALGEHRIKGYVERLKQISARVGPRRLLVETSTGDTFRKVNEQLSQGLGAAGLAADFIMPPGPHNQPFLRDSGTLELLLWHDRLPR